MFEPLTTLLGWAILLLIALPALSTGLGAIRRPPHRGARGRGFGVFLLGLAQAGAAAWLMHAL